jgi:lipopolysaccharide export system permease protein
MIFQRAIRRELLNTVGAVFTVLFTIVMTVMLIRILGDAASGKIAPKDVAAMLGFAALGYLPVIISLTAFIAVLMVVARSYQDSEMVVWLASGASLTQWIRPVLSVGMPMVLADGSVVDLADAMGKPQCHGIQIAIPAAGGSGARIPGKISRILQG